MAMADSCIICYKVVPQSSLKIRNEETPNLFLKEQESLKRFFRLLKSYLRGDDDDKGSLEHGIFGFLEQVISAGLSCCEDCSKIVSSFCQLYDQIRKLEVVLNWKLGVVKDIMERSGSEPQKVKEFGERVNQLNIGWGGGYEIWSFKKQLVTKCQRKLSKTAPRVRLRKYDPQKVEQPICKIIGTQVSVSDSTQIKHTVIAPTSPIKVESESKLLHKLKKKPSEKTTPQSLMKENANNRNTMLSKSTPKNFKIIEEAAASEEMVVKTEPGLPQETDPLADADDGDEAAYKSATMTSCVKSEPATVETHDYNENLGEQGDEDSIPVIASIQYSHQIRNPPSPNLETNPVTEFEGEIAGEGTPTVFLKPVETITITKRPSRNRAATSRLRNVHRCPKCAKTFSTPDKLEDHELAHGTDEVWESWSSSDNSSCDEDADKDGASDPGSDISDCSDDGTQRRRFRKPWLPSLNPIFQASHNPTINTRMPQIYKICNVENCKRPLYSRSHYDNHMKYHAYRHRTFPVIPIPDNHQEPTISIPATATATKPLETQKRLRAPDDFNQPNLEASTSKHVTKRPKLLLEHRPSLTKKPAFNPEANQQKKEAPSGSSSRPIATFHICDMNGCSSNFRTTFQLQVHKLTVHGVQMEPRKFSTSPAQAFPKFKRTVKSTNFKEDLKELSIFKNFKMKSNPKLGNGMKVTSMLGNKIKAPKVTSSPIAKQQLPNSRIKITNTSLNTKVKLMSKRGIQK